VVAPLTKTHGTRPVLAPQKPALMNNTHDQTGSGVAAGFNVALPKIKRPSSSAGVGKYKGKNRRARGTGGTGGTGETSKHMPSQPTNAKHKRERKLWGRYGLDEESYTLLFEKQNCVCPICKEPLEKHGDSTVINYERVSGYKELTPSLKRTHVRALLCRPCDTGVRMFRGSEDALIGAVVFLRTH